MRLLKARTCTLLAAATDGIITSAALTHNPLCHLIPFFSPIFLLSAPWLGGVAARGKTRMGPIGALFVGCLVAAVNTAPFMLVWPFLVYYRDKFDSPVVAENVIHGAGIFLICWWCYTALGVMGGVTLRSLNPKMSSPSWVIHTEPHTVQTTGERELVASDTRIAVGTDLGGLLTREVDATRIRPSLN